MNHPVCSKCGYSLDKNGDCSNSRCESAVEAECVSIREAALRTSELFDGRQWGNWKFQADNLTLQHQLYEVDLERIHDSAEMLDWIFQVLNKPWAIEKDLADLLVALDDIFGPQNSLCSLGKSTSINPTEFLRGRIAVNG